MCYFSFWKLNQLFFNASQSGFNQPDVPRSSKSWSFDPRDFLFVKMVSLIFRNMSNILVFYSKGKIWVLSTVNIKMLVLLRQSNNQCRTAEIKVKQWCISLIFSDSEHSLLTELWWILRFTCLFFPSTVDLHPRGWWRWQLTKLD